MQFHEIRKREILLEALENVEGIVKRGYVRLGGICDALNHQVVMMNYHSDYRNEVYDLMTFYWEKWPKYSGIRLFPVPGPMGEYALEAWGDHIDKWSGPYGDLRKDLLNFLIESIKKDLDNVNESM